MKILHYALGFPPYRSGGLTKFCVDLMAQQAKEGHTVAMLWPGQMGIINKTVTVKKHKDIMLKGHSICSFEVINPLPVSFDEGIADIKAFTMNARKEVYEELFETFQPNVIHVHTLMGLHKIFLDMAKEKKIRIVFTAHDFFPICPKVTVFRRGVVCESVQNCEECGVCNATALNLNKIKILQSPLYRRLKDLPIVKKMRKKHRDKYLGDSNGDSLTEAVASADDYRKLRNYYYSLLKLMDSIHYNSSVTKEVYESFFDLPNNRIIGITHSDISDNRKIREYSDDRLRIRYLGPQGGEKGFFLLKKALDQLWGKQHNFCLDVHFIPTSPSPYINVHDRYSYMELDTIFDETDILVVPSLWHETFGFTVLEALSYGVPVVMSGNVGAKDILVDGAGIVIDDITADKLCSALSNITSSKLKEMNMVICKRQPIREIEEMSKQIEMCCYGRILRG